ncbi:hypothetical protein pb186bvf_015597 [Paramecium bursaria]
MVKPFFRCQWKEKTSSIQKIEDQLKQNIILEKWLCFQEFAVRNAYQGTTMIEFRFKQFAEEQRIDGLNLKGNVEILNLINLYYSLKKAVKNNKMDCNFNLL